MRILVQKFGGSSVATPARIKACARRIVAARERGYHVVAVVSALGDTTDDLIELARQVTDQPARREMDALLSTGELISSSLMAMAVERIGYPAVSLSGRQAGIITDDVHTRARIVNVDPTRLHQELQNDRVVIVAGFQGINSASDVTTLGRGGSDTSAVALAAALQAESCEIFTDVDGIYTADPRVVPKARKLADISYGEMLEMASLGALVLQPRAVEFGAQYGIPIHVRSSYNEGEGTIVRGERRMEKDMLVVGSAHDTNVAKVALIDVPDRPGIAHRIFSQLATEGVNVDMIVQTNRKKQVTDLVFSTSRDDLPLTRKIINKVREELQAGEALFSDDVAKVSIVGAGMVSNPGVAARMFEALAEIGANIHVISTSEIKVSCLIDEDKAEEAMRAIHTKFDLDQVVSTAADATTS